MTTATSFAEYSEIEGFVSKGGVALADVLFDLKYQTDVYEVDRSGSLSNLYRPGKLKMTSCKIKRAHINADLDGAAISTAAVSGTAETLKTARALTADGWVDNSDTVIATASRIRLTVVTAAVTTAGYIDVVGEDAAGNSIMESIYVGLLGVGEYATGKTLFKQCYGTYNHGVVSATGTLTVASIALSSSYTVGEPLVFDLVGYVLKGTRSITFTLPDCWIKDGGLSFYKSGSIEEEHEVVMRDPSKLTIAETT